MECCDGADLVLGRSKPVGTIGGGGCVIGFFETCLRGLVLRWRDGFCLGLLRGLLVWPV